MEEKLHLLFDSGFIKSYGNMEPVLGKPEKAAQNPLFRNDSRKKTGVIPQNDPWKYQIYCSYPNIFRDPVLRRYRCYYTVLLETEEGKAGTKTERGSGLITALAYAESEDGLHWERPALGLVEFRGGRENNLLRLYAHGSSLFYDYSEERADRRYKLFTRDDRNPVGMCVAFSEDGLRFGDYIPAGIEERIIGDTHNFCSFDAEKGEYFLTTRAFSNKNRLVMACSSRDFIHWSGAKQIFRGDTPEYQSYSMPVFSYAGLWFGLVSIYHGGDMDSPLYDKVECELVYGTDRESFSRVVPHESFLPLGSGKDAYDDGCIYCAAPVEHEEEFLFYYTGGNGKHTGFKNASLQLASLKKSRLAGMAPKDRERPGRLTTLPMPLKGQKLLLDSERERGGYICCRLLAADGKVTAGFDFQDFDRPSEKNGEWTLTWNGQKSPAVPGDYMLEFTVYKAAVYQLKEVWEA